MTITLTPYEARIIGCLLEKEVTTPDQYPLTLNSLTTAANQKSNREPVYSLDEATVMDTVEALKEKTSHQRNRGIWKPGYQISAPILQHRIWQYQTSGAGIGDHLRPVTAWASNAWRIAYSYKPPVSVLGRVGDRICPQEAY